MKKILIHTLIFSPDGVSTAYLYNDIALAFQRKGYEVVVLTTTPHFNVVEKHMVEQPLVWKFPGLFKMSLFCGIKVYHVPQKKFKRTFMRLLGFIYWHIISFFIGLSIKNVDIILSPSPPLTIGLINLWLAKFKRCKAVYNVQEIYPDILCQNSGLVYNMLSKIERKIYYQSDAVTTIDQVFYNTIKSRFNDQTKLHIIPNFVDTELYNPSASIEKLPEALFPRNNSIKMLYAGNIGFAQEWDILLKLAKKTEENDIEYFIIGEGVTKAYLEEKQKELSLSKVHILPYQPRNIMPSILAFSDVQFIFMNPEMEMQGFPSKVYTIMACAKPLLVCSGEGTPIVNFLKEYNCAKLITVKENQKKVEEMSEWLSSVTREQLQSLGKNGIDAIHKYYSKDIVTNQYVDLIDSLLK